MTEPDQGASLAMRTAKGAGWLMGWRLASRVLGVVSTVVLVRLLTPADFGLVALAVSFSLAIDAMSYVGVQDALIREASLDRAMYDTGFTINLLRGLATALLIGACAWPAARFFGDARLATIFLALALSLLLSACENIGTIDFQRDLTFNKQFQLLVLPRILSTLVSLSCALLWASYWALVAGFLTNRAMRLVFSYVFHPHRPMLTLRAWRRLIGFSLWSWALSMTALVHARIDTIIIGGFLNPTQVGFYSVANDVGLLPSTELVEPLSRALFSGFATARRTGGSVADAFFRAISVIFLFTLPAGVGLAMIAQPLMHLAFGPRWDAALPLVRVFALIGTFRVIASISGVMLMAEGVPHIGFRVELASVVIRVISLLVLVPWLGILGAAIAVGICAAVEEAIYLTVTFRRFRLRFITLMRQTWRPVLATAVMAACLWLEGGRLGTTAETPWALGTRIALMVAAGVVLYGAALFAAWLASGRPGGAEVYLLATARRVMRSRARR